MIVSQSSPGVAVVVVAVVVVAVVAVVFEGIDMCCMLVDFAQSVKAVIEVLLMIFYPFLFI